MITYKTRQGFKDFRMAVKEIETASPLPGTYQIFTPNGEEVMAQLAFFSVGTPRRVWVIEGRALRDEELIEWKIGPRLKSADIKKINTQE